MPLKGRSPDDLPLAAYSTGVDPATEPDHDPLGPATDDPSGTTVAAHAAAAGYDPDLPADPFGQAAPPADPGRTTSAQPAFRDVLRNPRGNARDPRLLLSGVVAVGLVLLVVSLAAGGMGKGPATAVASPSAPAGPVFTAAPAGDASVEITGAVTGTFDLTGVTGTGRPSGPRLDSRWGDLTGDALVIGGPVSAGTRATDEGLVLSWTVMVKGKAVTFTSKAGECVIGMAVKPTTVSGSFTCRRVKSADGKLVIGASGTYRT
jgi:hypothetical protein